ncbi:MAG: hypothetical protein BAJALOKI1v1_290009 [Promethearchaeota archaeon]|nr:MAG: hypothetical protein BAJALOKI1v1_290009 [Candidatus Lokiarchaeota archaeon]
MSEKLDDIFEQFSNVFLGREEEIKEFLLKYKKDAFIKQDVLNIERIDASERLETSGFRKNLSMWQNFYKNLIVSVCMEIKRDQKRFDYKFFFTEEKLDSKLLEQVEDIIKEANKLMNRAKFEEALERVDVVEQMVAEKQDKYFNKQLRNLRQEIRNAREEYNTKVQKIEELEKYVQSEREQQNLEEALQKSKEIVKIAESINHKQFKKKYEEIITEINKEKTLKRIQELEKKLNDYRNKKRYQLAIDVCNQIIRQAEKVQLDNEIEKYEKLIEDIKRERIENEISGLKQKVENNRNSGRYHVAISNCQKIITLAESINSEHTKDVTLKIVEDITKEMDQKKKRDQIENTISQLENEFSESNKTKDYEECLEIALEIIELAGSIEEKEIWKKYTQYKDEIVGKLAQKEELRNQRALEEEIQELETQIEENQRSNNLEMILVVSNQIIEISTTIERDDITEKYEKLIKDTKQKIEDKRKKEEEEALKDQKISEIQKVINDKARRNKEEQALLLQKAREFENIIQIDEDVMPLIEEFTIDEIIGDLSDDTSQILDQLNSLLKNHRVEIKENITSEALLISTTGEIIELDENIQVQKNEEEEELIVNLKSGFKNPFDEVVEEAIISDLIPYNFEILNIELNGEDPKEIPDKTLIQNGLEMKWQLHNIPAQESVEISYDLRKRISRTIIFLLKDQLKIIKTHSTIKDSKPKVEGLYDAKLPFNNSYENSLDGLVIEDIIPLYYIHNVREPTNYLPQEQKMNQGSLVKWNIGILEPSTINYHYKLLELYRFEELKALIHKLDAEGFEALENDNVIDSLKKYNEILNLLNEFIQ